jgi:hypothetical protein
LKQCSPISALWPKANEQQVLLLGRFCRWFDLFQEVLVVVQWGVHASGDWPNPQKNRREGGWAMGPRAYLGVGASSP